ncbi:hypothetical protein F5Y16DRAFT_159081 [Xylariaceae sp. FL0255]|nr:hypothetical protein F5Y16DRAFT_159081 [Xylariaceae sp. FL0255]
MDRVILGLSKGVETVVGGAKVAGHHCVTAAKYFWQNGVSVQRLKEPTFILVAIFLVLGSVTAYIARKQKLAYYGARPSTPTAPGLEKAQKPPAREFGKWTPSEYRMPTPEPYPDWSIEHTKPLPYRPFRYGPKYNVTMGLRSVKPVDWIELDNHFPRFQADKARRIAERGEKLSVTVPEGYPAALELLEEFADYLPARYPSLFKRTAVGIDNLWSGESFDIVSRPLAEDPMQMCARLVQDDLAIMIERADGQYYLLAGSIVLPGFWRLSDKLGMPLSEIHTSGDVPQFKEKLEKGMINMFRRLKPEEMVARNNYFFQVDDNLGWSLSIGPEDGDKNGHVGWITAEKNKAIDHHWFRSERQTLRRLPKTGGIVFTIRTYFHPIKEVVEEDYVPGRLASAVRSWGDDVSRYKGKERYGEVLLEFLDKKHEEQVVRGLDLSREDEVRAYPY